MSEICRPNTRKKIWSVGVDLLSHRFLSWPGLLVAALMVILPACGQDDETTGRDGSVADGGQVVEGEPCAEFGNGGIGVTGEIIDTQIPCGNYGSFDEIIEQSGTRDTWIRYQAERPGCVELPAGATPPDKSFWILDGVRIVASEGDDAVTVTTDDVGFEHCELAGPQDVFTGQPSCTEAATQSGMGNLIGRTNVWFHDCDIHGFAQTFLTQDARVRISHCFVHNNRNGLSLRGIGAVYCYNVLWMNPNHGLLIEENSDRVAESDVLFVHNLVVDTQESVFQYGGARYRYLYNTWADDGSQDCGFGMGILLLDRGPSGPYGGENKPILGPLSFVGNFMGGPNGEPHHFYRFEVDPSLITESDYNYVYAPDGAIGEFARRSWPEDQEQDWTLEQWRADHGLDAHSKVSDAAPLFADPRVEPVPATWQEAWERFRPAAGSPLCGTGPDGKDLGAVACPR